MTIALLLIAAMTVTPHTSAFPIASTSRQSHRQHQSSLNLFAPTTQKQGHSSSQQLNHQEEFAADRHASSRFSMLFASLEEYTPDSLEDYSTKEETTENQMDHILWVLSCTESDAVRRSNLAALLKKEHAKTANSWNEFATLFESRLKNMGDIAQKEVKTQLNQNIYPSKKRKGKKNWIPKQLWACVDMMVQSKSIIKRCENTAIAL